MALREILTHQGASAGVFISDSLDSAPLVQFEDEFITHTMKREREIDLNMQGSTDEFEPDLKRPKFEDVSSQWMDTMVVARKDSNSDISVKVEDDRRDLGSELINEYSNVGSVKVEPDSYLDTSLSPSKEVAAETTILKDYSSIKEMDVAKSLSENGELMNWIKFARHSWLKNSQFLQDCAIRFLCVLALDR